MNEIYKKIVLQHCVTDEKNLAFKKKAKLRCLLSGWIAAVVGFANFLWYDFHHNFHSIIKELKGFWHDYSGFILAIISVLLICFMLYKKFHRIKVFSYFYSTRLPFMVIPSIYSDDIRSITPLLDSFVHAKVYVIDESIYIGSANLTKSGVRHNIESVVKISDHKTVKEFIAEIDGYLNAQCRPININHLGSCLYYEAPY